MIDKMEASKMIVRTIAGKLQNTSKSVLLLGPRQVGKSTLILSFGPDLVLNLANENIFLSWATDPGFLADQIERQNPRVIFVDEVQRLPSCLNTIQYFIDQRKIKFYLTGSSARKLKRGGANLLPGRVFNYSLGPLTLKELDHHVNVPMGLQFGFLPEVITLKDPEDKKALLLSYTLNYIKEEIKAEALTKSLEAFARFLAEATLAVGQNIDYTKLAHRAKISRHTVPNYFEILEDTLLGYRIHPDRRLMEKIDLVKHPKFYFFDVGVYNALQKDFSLAPERRGILAEQLVFSQLHHSAAALQKNCEIFTFRTRGGLEIDFLLSLEGQYVGIEVKYSDDLDPSAASGLKALNAYLPKAERLIIHMGRKERKIDGIWALPLSQAFQHLGL